MGKNDLETIAFGENMDCTLSNMYNSVVRRYEEVFAEDFTAIDTLSTDYFLSIIKIIEFWARSDSLMFFEDQSGLDLAVRKEYYSGGKVIERIPMEFGTVSFSSSECESDHFHSTDFHGDLNSLMYFLLRSGLVSFKQEENHVVFYDIKKKKKLSLRDILILPKDQLPYCFPIPNLIVNTSFRDTLTLGGDFIDRGEFSIPTILTVLYVLEQNARLPYPRNIGACIGNHEYDLIKNSNLDEISTSISSILKEAIAKDLFRFCFYVFSDMVVSHGVLATDLPKILNVLTENDIQLFLPGYDNDNMSTETFLSLPLCKEIFDLINLGAKRIMLDGSRIKLCDACVFDIPVEAPWLMSTGFERLKFRNIIGHQIDNIDNLFRIPAKIDGFDCRGRFFITDACQCRYERENVARNCDITPARYLRGSSCCGANISSQLVSIEGEEHVMKQPPMKNVVALITL